MSEDKGKKCSKCRTVEPLDHFDEGKALCQKCSQYKQRYRADHREELRQKANKGTLWTIQRTEIGETERTGWMSNL